MASKKDAALELGENLLRVLNAQRALGADAYPLTVKRLTEIANLQATPAQIEKALNKKSFKSQAVVARRKDLQSPIALAADAERLAESRILLEYLLQTLHTPSNQAFSVSNLKAKASSKLQKPFQIALNAQIDRGTLPPTIGWLTITRSKKLFLLADVHTHQKSALPEMTAEEVGSGCRTGPGSAGTPDKKVPSGSRDLLLQRSPVVAGCQPADVPPASKLEIVPHEEFAAAFDEAFQRLDQRAGRHNFVSLLDLRAAVPIGRDVFDAELHKLRLGGNYSLSAAEGRLGLSPEEHAAGILEEGTLMLYVSVKKMDSP